MYSRLPDGQNENYFYRIRPYDSSDLHKGLKSTLKVSEFDGQESEIWEFRNQKLYNVNATNCLGGPDPDELDPSISDPTSQNPASVSAELVNEDSAYVLIIENAGISGDNACYITTRLGERTFYLDYSSGALSWKSTISNSCRWGFELLIKFTQGGMDFGRDYFNEYCGDAEGGSFPSKWVNAMKNLYKYVYYPNGVGAPTSFPDSQIFYNLYGALYSGGVPRKISFWCRH
jgi:hypothetical protein